MAVSNLLNLICVRLGSIRLRRNVFGSWRGGRSRTRVLDLSIGDLLYGSCLRVLDLTISDLLYGCSLRVLDLAISNLLYGRSLRVLNLSVIDLLHRSSLRVLKLSIVDLLHRGRRGTTCHVSITSRFGCGRGTTTE